MNNFKKILIVRTDRIGDVVLTTPSFKALRMEYPKAHIAVLVAPSTRDLVEGNPFIDEVIVDDRKQRHRGWRFFKLVHEIRKRKFDLAVVYHTKKRTNSLCFFAGIPVRVGYRNNKFGFLLTHKIPDLRPEGKKHEAQYCLDVLKSVGVEGGDLSVTVPLQPESEQWAEDFVKKLQKDGGKLIAIHFGSSCPTKKWPAGRFAGLMEVLEKKYSCRILLVGGRDDMVTAATLKDGKEPEVLDLTGKTSLAQLASLLRRCDLLISNDSGPVHVAAAMGTPVVSIFTRNQPGINPERWRPLGEKSRTVVTKFQGDISFAKGAVTDCEYLEAITVEEVLEAVDDIFKLC